MKHNGFFYSIAIVAAFGLLMGFIHYTKGALPTQIPRTSDVVSGEKHQSGAMSSKTTATTDAVTVEKDACGCCSQLHKRIEERRRELRERKKAKERASSTDAS